MSNVDITRLVVGQSASIVLGKPVGQTHQTRDISNTLKWDNGVWEPNKRTTWPSWRSQSTTIGLIAKKWSLFSVAKVALVMLGLAGTGVGLGLMYGGRSQDNPQLPMTPAVSEGAIKMVDKPFIDPAADPSSTGALPQSAQGLPIAPMGSPLPPLLSGQIEAAMPDQPAGAKVDPADVSRSVTTNPPAESKPIPPSKPSTAETKQGRSGDQEKPRNPAVMIFDDAPSGRSATAPASAQEDKKPTAPDPKAAGTTGKPTDSLSARADSPASVPVGLVAIPPGGKSAVFTNPKTRLPEQFKVGDKLPSGETITSINAADGKVQTNRKEYNLD